MQGYEFVAELQRVSAIASLFEKVDLEAMEKHLAYAEQVAPMFESMAPGHGSERVKEVRRFLAKAKEFKGVCVEYRARLIELETATVPRLASGSRAVVEPSQGE